jgi:hypothetical protein
MTKNLSQDSRSPGRDLKPGPPEYEAGVLTTRPRRSVPLPISFEANVDNNAPLNNLQPTMF